MNRILIILYLISMPFYFFSSGVPQLSSLFLVAFIIINFHHVLNTFRFKISYFYIVMFIYICLVNIFYFYITQNLSFLITTSFYLFNLLIMTIFFSLLINKRSTIKYILMGSIISITIQFILSFFITGDYHDNRITIFFNNPNQLAAYAVTIVALSLTCNKILKGRILIDIYILSVGFYLTFLSASKAGLASLIVLIFLYFFINNFSRTIKLLSYLTSLIIALFAFLIFTDNRYLYGFTPQLDFVMHRFNHNQNHQEGILKDRGYDRILENFEYIILGAGEGYYTRFNTTMELHSIFGTMLFSYGLIGLLLFGGLLTYIIFKLPFHITYVIIAPLLYGITHQSLRLTVFWILLAVLLSMIQINKAGKHKADINKGVQ